MLGGVTMTSRKLPNKQHNRLERRIVTDRRCIIDRRNLVRFEDMGSERRAYSVRRLDGDPILTR